VAVDEEGGAAATHAHTQVGRVQPHHHTHTKYTTHAPHTPHAQPVHLVAVQEGAVRAAQVDEEHAPICGRPAISREAAHERIQQRMAQRVSKTPHDCRWQAGR
jgi:hypothetical protein